MHDVYCCALQDGVAAGLGVGFVPVVSRFVVIALLCICCRCLVVCVVICGFWFWWFVFSVGLGLALAAGLLYSCFIWWFGLWAVWFGVADALLGLTCRFGF